MKIHKNSVKNLTALICFAGLLTFLVSSCGKSNVDPAPAPPAAGFTFIQASPDQPLLNLYFNNTRINSSFISYGQTVNNVTITPGKFLVKCSDDAAGKVIVADSINFKQNGAYSIFLANTVAQPEIFILTDTVTKPASGKANIRFVNVSPDAPAVDLVVKGGSTLVVNKSFKGFSSFAPITGNTYTVEVHQAGTSTVLATMANITLNSGSVYTFWFHGLAGATTAADKLTLDVINNAVFF